MHCCQKVTFLEQKLVCYQWDKGVLKFYCQTCFPVRYVQDVLGFVCEFLDHSHSTSILRVVPGDQKNLFYLLFFI